MAYGNGSYELFTALADEATRTIGEVGVSVINTAGSEGVVTAALLGGGAYYYKKKKQA